MPDMTRVLKWFSPLQLIKWVNSSLTHQLIVGGVLLLATAIAVVVALLVDGSWYSGFETKSFWDWMQLLLIPLTIVIIGTIFQFSENRTDREIGKERVQQETLNSYLDSMGTLIVNGGLDQPQTVQVMRARTAATIRVLANVDHRNAVFGFLRDADLIGRRMEQDGNDDTQPNGPKPVALLERIVLMAANLRRANLLEANLTRAVLREADLRRASPRGGQPGVGLPLRGQPDGGQPNGGQPEGGQPGRGLPVRGQPDGGQPNGGQPNGGQPEAGHRYKPTACTSILSGRRDAAGGHGDRGRGAVAGVQGEVRRFGVKGGSSLMSF